MSERTRTQILPVIQNGGLGVCADFDEDCPLVGTTREDFEHCWRHDPTLGYCPFLCGRTQEPA